MVVDNEPQKEPPEGYQKKSLGNGLYGFEFGHVFLKYLPPNYTSHIQPLDQGIIRALNSATEIVCWIGPYKNFSDIVRTLIFSHHMLYSRKSLPWLKQCWSEIGHSAFANCFRKAGTLQENNCLQEETTVPVCFQSGIGCS